MGPMSNRYGVPHRDSSRDLRSVPMEPLLVRVHFVCTRFGGFQHLHTKSAEEIMREIESLSSLAPEDVPEVSRFLLKINFTELSEFHIETHKYWTLMVNAACTAQELNSARGTRAKQAKQVANTRIASRKKLGIVAIEQQIRKNRMHQSASQNNTPLEQHSQTLIDSFTTKRPHPASITRVLRSNKRLCKPD